MYSNIYTTCFSEICVHSQQCSIIGFIRKGWEIYFILYLYINLVWLGPWNAMTILVCKQERFCDKLAFVTKSLKSLKKWNFLYLLAEHKKEWTFNTIEILLLLVYYYSQIITCGLSTIWVHCKLAGIYTVSVISTWRMDPGIIWAL